METSKVKLKVADEKADSLQAFGVLLLTFSFARNNCLKDYWTTTVYTDKLIKLSGW